MSWEAIALVLAAAVAHASWNMYAKRAAVGGVTFLWLCTMLGTIVYAPLALWQVMTAELSFGLAETGLVLASSALHAGYFAVLQRGYAVGDLSVVYPVARGLGPVLAIAGAVMLFGERPSIQALAGGGAICAAVAVIGLAGRGTSAGRGSTQALGFAVLTGVAISSYTLVDAYAVTVLALPPLLFTWIGSAARVLLLAPLVWPFRARLVAVWSEHRGAVVSVSVLSPLAYLLVLIAFTLAPVSYVAPLRELSIVIGAFLGTQLLAEGRGRVRIPAAAAVLIGVILVITG